MAICFCAQGFVLGVAGTAAGLLDPNVNMTYAVKYLAGAYRAADGNANRAVHYYASGYYYAAKRKGIDAYASASESGAPVQAGMTRPAERLRAARDAGMSVSSSSSLYSGRLDIY